MADFLFELGLEEVPARMLASAEAELARRAQDLLTRERLLAPDATIESFSTPRRLAVLVHGVLPQQEERQEDLLGPPVKAAYKDGVPTPAAHAFAKKAGIAVDALRTVTNSKGEYLAATVTHAGRSAEDVLVTELPKEIASIYWAKSMVWRPGKSERFVRPVQWMLALLDERIVPVEWAGIAASNCTYGHRILHGPAAVAITTPNDYRNALRSAYVLADVEERRHKMRKALDHATRDLQDARWREDHSLVDKVTHLTEWPSVILGSFEPEFLQLPEEVLVTVMRDHQNYFAPQGPDGKLLPNFLAVLNTAPTPHAAKIIRHNNERVLRARFNDAKFFYDFDQRKTLEARVSDLEKITFHKDLGSYAAKSARMQELAGRLADVAAGRGTAVDTAALAQAARLAKTDLTTELVKEFTELQGMVGGLYALQQGSGQRVATAIYDQYLPASMEDSLPRTTEGLLLSIADKADTINGMFGLGLQPTGSKDPFALRRAANGIIKMLAESNKALPLSLSDVAFASFGGVNGETSQQVEQFLTERLAWYLREVRGHAYDVVNAVMATRPTDVRDAVSRVEAVTLARATEDFTAISAAFKRMKNIVEQAAVKGEPISQGSRADSTVQPEQAGLEAASAHASAEAQSLAASGNYEAALQTIATLRPTIDAFFDKVMVMDPDPVIRTDRLGLLARILHDFSRIADFSEIVIAG